MPSIKEHAILKGSKSKRTSLEDAAKMMCKMSFGLSPSHHTAMKEFLSLIDKFKTKVNKKPLPELLKHIWVMSGLQCSQEQEPEDNTGEEQF